MPRNGSGVYSHPFPDVVEGTTIESAVFNGNTSDVEQDLNTPRPIVAGGTGASNAHDAMVNLSGEIAMQVVTNYDSFPFEAGSFYSTPGATGEPIPGGGFYTSGICHMINVGSMVLEAYVYNQGGVQPVRKFTREKWATWEPWKQAAMTLADSDARYVNQTGDVMTGSLTIQPASGPPLLVLNKTGAVPMGIISMTSGISRWSMDLGDGAPESGGNAGSNFYIRRYDDAGAQIGLPMIIDRASGAVTFGGALTAPTANINGIVWSITAPTTGQFQFGNSGTKSLSYDGTTFQLAGGGLNIVAGGIGAVGSANIAGDITCYRSFAVTTGYHFFGNSGTKYLGYDGANFAFQGGGLTTGGAMTVAGSANIQGDLNLLRPATPTTGYVTFGNIPGAKYLGYDGTNFVFQGGGLILPGIATQLVINPLSGLPQVSFLISNVTQSYINDNGGSINIYSNGGGTAGMYIIRGGNAWTAISDARLSYKQTATPMTVLDKLDAIQLYENIVNDRPDMFAKAQELNVGFPHMVYPGAGPEAQNKDYVPTGMSDTSAWGVSYDRAGIAALQGLKELRDMVTELRAEIASLKAGK